ncbi:MAG: hypothetical protein RIC56_08030 [Pseudomonadales bacterium]
MDIQPTCLPRSGLSAFLFIYLVRDVAARPSAAGRYCTVVAFGRSLEAAERIAINRVHQQGLHIVRADTATAAPWLDPTRDGDYLDELGRYGCALKLGAPACDRLESGDLATATAA